MSQIKVHDLTFTYESTYENIFEHVSFTIDTDWKLGFIGRNGRGKTTFLNLLQNKYEYLGSIESAVDFDYFPFDLNDTNIAARKVAKAMIAPFEAWEQQMERYLAAGDETSLLKYGEVLERYEYHNGYQIEDHIEKELGKLSVEPEILDRPFNLLSYGERTKVMLGAMFLKKNSFLLIDEPTNHLDLSGREILGNYLNHKRGFLLVSHDRDFLNRCIDHVLSINKTDIEVQKGNYDSWQHNKDLWDQYELHKNENLRKEVQRLTVISKRTASWSDQTEQSKIGTHSADRGYIGHKSAKMMKRAKAAANRQEASLQEKKELLKNVEQTEALKMNPLEFSRKRMAELSDVSFYFGNRLILKEINLTIERGDRIALKGKNGCGKSTLINIILGRLTVGEGLAYQAAGLKISYVSQDTSMLKGTLQSYGKLYEINETIFLTVLRQLGFSRLQLEKDMADYSGGQKKKVLLAASLSQPANLFIWDEPLNYVDIISRIQIEELILLYQPTMVFVEHDRMFMERIATKVLQL